MSSIKVINNSNKKAQSSKKEYFVHDVLCFLNDSLPEEVNIKKVLKKVEKTVPKKLFYNLDYIYIGDFPELKLRDVQSAYMRGAIYIINIDQTEQSLFASIIHELAHSVETTFGSKIYEDQEVAAEFVGKRKKLRTMLSIEGFEFKDPTVFIRTEYNPDFDAFLYKQIGYEKLNQLCVGIFMSAYAATSLREYFANGFEHYYLGDSSYLEKLSPKLYKKISFLTSK
jgi:hypothetical protein